ncbi:MAG: type I glutamate--ammonia ligase [Herpetosiphon sp.]
MAPGDAKGVLAFGRENNIQIVDIKFCDLPGSWQHFSLPFSELTEDMFTEGLGFDGSSIRGFQKINESDMLITPDPSTAIVDPACRIPTLSMVGEISDPLTGEKYSRDPRYIARKAEAYLQKTGLADTAFFGPEVEFFIFNNIRFDQGTNFGYYEIDSEEGIWNSGSSVGKNLGHRPRHKEGYFPVPPTDKLQDLRSEITLELIKAGIQVEVHHHEVATAGQTEIDMRFGSLLKQADNVLLYKYVVKNVCDRNGYTATFMPKPLFGDNGSGMHVHMSLWNEGKPLFYDEKGYGGLSEMARHYVGGLLAHAPSLLAFAAPTTNSYRRLVPGFEAPINLVYSSRNRSACVRIPTYSKSPKAKRIELRMPDPTANPYLAFSAMLLAGLDGIQNKIEPPAPVDADIYELSPEERAHIKSTPGSLLESLDALKNDHGFLLQGGVFTKDVIEHYIDYKYTHEVQQMALRPHPYEFFLYYDA